MVDEEVLFEDRHIDASTPAPSQGEHTCEVPASSGHVGGSGSSRDVVMGLLGELQYFGVSICKYNIRLEELEEVRKSMQVTGINLGVPNTVCQMVNVAEMCGLSAGSFLVFLVFVPSLDMRKPLGVPLARAIGIGILVQRITAWLPVTSYAVSLL